MRGRNHISTATAGRSWTRSERRFAGFASAAANTPIQAGSSIGIAVLNAVAVGVVANRRGVQAQIEGFVAAIGLAAFVVAATAIISFALMAKPSIKHVTHADRHG